MSSPAKSNDVGDAAYGRWCRGFLAGKEREGETAAKKALHDGTVDVLTLVLLGKPSKEVDDLTKRGFAANPKILVTVREEWHPFRHEAHQIMVRGKSGFREPTIRELRADQDAPVPPPRFHRETPKPPPEIPGLTPTPSDNAPTVGQEEQRFSLTLVDLPLGDVLAEGAKNLSLAPARNTRSICAG